jgi:hypothetical protein
MPWWVWVLGALVIFFVLAFIGYLMGPQGGRALTKRDQRILERRSAESQAYMQSSGHLADVAGMAEGAVGLARQDNAAGIPPTQALALAFEKMEHFERVQGDPDGLGPWIMQMTGYLMEMGVVNAMEPEQFEARIPGFSAETLKRDPVNRCPSRLWSIERLPRSLLQTTRSRSLRSACPPRGLASPITATHYSS